MIEYNPYNEDSEEQTTDINEYPDDSETEISDFSKDFTHFMAIMLSIKGSRPIPYHTSVLTGTGWVLELLNGHPE
ncbi:hypothetical protein PAXRUDRAFT_19691 [Paxillus rubicundulus Ve08.2h10]|uniref:Uncharacterized protein n=1 Tax=Paxillus rubicundulus Ve08.2h10 TaxID=930991 RepID=A0A0D0BT57_9AGAM|nr:hypothetical protein PAXRUDRAFT_19691 [Paxillus rubicundulus Ve08.2h10]